MKLTASLTLALLVCASAFSQTITLKAKYGNHNGVPLQDQLVTPGAVRTTDMTEICAATFRTGPFRHTTASQKRHVCASYGVKRCPREGVLEIDHLVPLELGGADEEANLWPQMARPAPGFHEKDQLENYLRRAVCANRMPLVQAQALLRKDWYAAYLASGLGKAGGR